MTAVKRLAVRVLAVLVVGMGLFAGSAITSQGVRAATIPPRVLTTSEMAQTFGDGEASKCVAANRCNRGQVGVGDACFRCNTGNTTCYTTCCWTDNQEQKCTWGAGTGTKVCGNNVTYQEIPSGKYKIIDEYCQYCEPNVGETWQDMMDTCNHYTDAAGDLCGKGDPCEEAGPSPRPTLRPTPRKQSVNAGIILVE